MSAASVIFALIAALLFAVSAALQQSVARTAALTAPRRSRLLTTIGLLGTLLTNPRWLAGQLASMLGFAMHAWALRLGSVAVVQALLVVQLLFALPLTAARRHIRPRARDWIGTAAVCAGLVTLVSQGIPRGESREGALPIAGAVVLAAIVTLVIAARLCAGRPQLRTSLNGVAAGCCFSATAVLVSVATAELPTLSWAWAGVAASTTLGMLLTQEAFASGSLPTALTAMTITDPVLSYVAGVTLFIGVAQPYPLTLVSAAALVVTGVVLLANSPTLHDEKDRRPVMPAAKVS